MSGSEVNLIQLSDFLGNAAKDVSHKPGKVNILFGCNLVALQMTGEDGGK